MPDAIVINQVSKYFGRPAGESGWTRLMGRAPVAKAPVAKSPAAAPANGPAVKTNGHASGANGKGVEGRVVAVNQVSFQVASGEIFGVLGPNGGGKSTLIRLISTLLLPDAGSIAVFGHDVVREAHAVRPLINRVSVEASFFKKLSPYENLIYGARLYGMDAADTRKQIAAILTRLGLDRRAMHRPMEEMSRGMQQKVAIARALLSKPRVLLLDEPTTGLDPRSKREVQAIVRELREKSGTTILLTTHDMVEADGMCDRIAIMDKGRVVALDTPAGLRGLLPSQNGQATTLEDVFLHLTGRSLAEDAETLALPVAA